MITTVPPRRAAAPRRTELDAPGPRSLPAGSVAMAAAVAAQTASNLVFHGIAGRSLGPAAYGVLGTLLGLALMVTIPLGSLQAAVNRAAALQSGASPIAALRRVGVVALGLGALVALAAVPLQAFLHLPSLFVTLLIAPYLVQAVVLAAARGVLLGAGRAPAVAATMGAATVLRLILGAALTPTFGVTGAMVATVAAEVVGLVAVLALVVRAAPASAPELRLTARDLGGSGLVVAGLWAFTSIDLLLAKHHLGAVEAGGYVAAATLAKCAMALPTALVMVVLPRFAAAPDEVAAHRELRRALGAISAVAVAGALPFVVAPGFFQVLLYGQAVAPNALVAGLAAISVLSSVATTITYFHLARARRAALLPWLGAGLEVAAISLAHQSAGAVALGSAIAAVPTAALLLASALRRPVAADAPTPDPAPATPPPAAPVGWSDRLWQAADPGVELSVVLPFYNPGESVGRTIARTTDVLRSAGISFEIIAVSDGSTDGSEVHVPVHQPEVHLIVSPANEGKGAAVQRGLAAARGSVCGFIDADGDIDPVHLVQYHRLLRAEDLDLVYASKRHPQAETEATGLRRIISLGYSSLVSVLFRLGVNDTQTGAKVFRRELAAAAVPNARERRFAFDLELFVLAHRLGFDRLAAAPVHLGERLAGSTVTGRAVARTFRDTLAIWVRLQVRREYPAGLGPVSQQPSTPALRPTPATALALPARPAFVPSTELQAA